ncbi:MAG: malonyl-ACP O-methyltransferase BioC [Pseudomonadota bacterium]
MIPEFALDPRQVRSAFERAAATYDEAAVLQREIAGRLLERLDYVRLSPARVLDAGCGTGYLLPPLSRRFRRADIVGLDVAAAMLRYARRRGGWLARLGNRRRYVAGDFAQLPFADASVDLVISSLALQWCRPDSVFAECRRVLRPGGLLLFSTFGPDTLQELRQAWSQVDDSAHVHGFADMHDLGDLLVHAGFAEPVLDVERLTLTYPSVRAALLDLKRIGAHNAMSGRRRGLTGKHRFAAFTANYEAMRREGRLPATYEVVYGQAWVPEQPSSRPRADGGVGIPLSAIVRRPNS